MNVFKFGGASVKDAGAVKNLASIIRLYDDNLVIVVSAMGKTTNAMENICNLYIKGDKSIYTSVEDIKMYHLNILEGLFDKNDNIYVEVEELFSELIEKLHGNITKLYDFAYDQIVSFGELISTKIVSAYLNKQGLSNKWVDIRKSLITDDIYRDAGIDWENSELKINEDFNFNDANIYVTQGFIGGTIDGNTTSLGREGSDYSAAILAYILNSEKVVIWKDVPGILNADPNRFDTTEMIDELSYLEAIELAYYGAKVIHPKTIKPLQNKKIPLHVKSFIDYKGKGTVIKSIPEALDLMPVYIVKDDQMLISISPKDFSFIVEENLSKIFAVFAKHRVKVNLTQNSAISFSVSVDNGSDKILKVLSELREEFKILYNSNVDLITVRHYNKESIERILNGREVLLQQKSRKTARFVVK